jgi:hypothetical protein
MNITEELLNEIFDSQFEVHRDHKLENELNHGLKNKIHSGHTAVMQSDHMKKHGHAVIKFLNKNKEVEYHLHHKEGTKNHKLDTLSMHHSLKIIRDDAHKELNKHRKIKLQANSDSQHATYNRLAQHLIKDHKGKKITDVGDTDKLDGSGKAITHIVEGKHDGQAINWNQFLNKLREKYAKN